MIPVSFRMVLLALLFLAAPAQAQLYKWVDANGRVQYSDRKPTDAKQQPQEVRNTVSSVGSQPSVAGGKSAAELDKDFQKRRQDQTDAQQKQQQAAAEQKQNSDACEAARRNLAGLNSGQRIARFNQQGEKSYLDDTQRTQETERAQQQVQTSCK
jgi:Domain of unknown function (DUF4124)